MTNTILRILLIVACLKVILVANVMATPTAKVWIEAPQYAKPNDTVVLNITVENVTNLNSGYVDIIFDKNVLEFINVSDGNINGTDIPIYDWNFIKTNTLRVVFDLPGLKGISGSGYLMSIKFKVIGVCLETYIDISGQLVNTDAEEIETEWHGISIKMNVPVVYMDAPTYITTDEIEAKICVDNVTNLNSAQIDITFNPEVFEVVDVGDGYINGTKLSVGDYWSYIKPDTVRVLSEVSGISGVSGSGYLAVVKFKVNRTLTKNETIKLNGLLVDKDGNEIPTYWKIANTKIANVSIVSKDLDSDGLFEDVDGNGKFNFGDVVALFQNFESWHKAGYDELYDFNRDGTLNFGDVIALFHFLP